MARRRNQAEETQHKDYVELYSELTVRVEPSVNIYEDATKKDSDIANRMKIIENHSKYGVLIRKGQYRYPGIILEWPVVKAMIEKKKFVVKSEEDTSGGNPELERQKEILDCLKDEKADGLEELSEAEEVPETTGE